MMYYANGGFNWHDIYYMPIKLREFYYRELQLAKDTERAEYEKIQTKSNSSKVKRR